MEAKHSDSNHWATNHTGSHEKSHLALTIILQIENYQEFGVFLFYFLLQEQQTKLLSSKMSLPLKRTDHWDD